jgi:hypothetical protein
MSSSPSPLRIAVLECDTPIGATKEKYGGYGNLFKELLNNGVKEVREKDNVEVPELDVRKYDVVNQETYPNIEDVDAVLLSGSREFYLWDGREGDVVRLDGWADAISREQDTTLSTTRSGFSSWWSSRRKCSRRTACG